MGEVRMGYLEKGRRGLDRFLGFMKEPENKLVHAMFVNEPDGLLGLDVHVLLPAGKQSAGERYEDVYCSLKWRLAAESNRRQTMHGCPTGLKPAAGASRLSQSN